MFNRRQKEEEKETGSPAWMVTYGDMMTLLLVFFVLLYSFSEMDLEKFKGFISSFQGRVHVLEGGRTVIDESEVGRGSQGTDFSPTTQGYTKVMGDISQYIEQEGLQEKVQMINNERGLVIRMTGQILYDLGRAVIKPEGKEVLDRIAVSIKEIDNSVMVEGHTDNWSINNNQYRDNWALSTTRACNVIRYFSEAHNIKENRMAAAGYGEFKPLVSNDTTENRAKNRRVEIVILKTDQRENGSRGGSDRNGR